MNTEIKCHYLGNHTLSSNLSREQLEDVAANAKFRVADKGESIYFENNADKRIYLLLKGVIKISAMSELGNEMIKEIIREGDFFGDITFNKFDHEVDYATSLMDGTIICSFNQDEFEGVLNRYSIMALNFARNISRKMRKLEGRHANLVFLDVKERLIVFFKEWAKTEGLKNGNTIRLNNYLTHNDIAGLISTSRQSVTVLLNELKDSGLFSYNRREIEINEKAFILN